MFPKYRSASSPRRSHGVGNDRLDRGVNRECNEKREAATHPSSLAEIYSLDRLGRAPSFLARVSHT